MTTKEIKRQRLGTDQIASAGNFSKITFGSGHSSAPSFDMQATVE